METIADSLLNRRRNSVCRIVFVCILFLLIYDFISHATLHQLQSPVLIFPYVDITYVLFNAIHIGDFITGNYTLACCFDVLLFAWCITVIISPGKKIFIALFFIFYFIYFLSYNSYGAHHIHSKVGILLIPIPFLFTGKNFLYTWEALRYFTLFLYADAFLWKLFRGTWAYNKQAIAIVKENIIPILYQHPDYKLADMYYYLFENPMYADVLFKAGILMEGLFIVGFFTKKFDRYLVVASLLLAFGFLLLADAFAFELLILNFTLLYNFKNPKRI